MTHEPSASEPLWFQVAGESQPGAAPIVFLHGGAGLNSSHLKNSVGTRLESAMEVVYLDQRGCGRSLRPPDGDYSLVALVDDIEAVRKLIGAETITLLGHSFGGVLGLEYASRYPERVARLIIMNASVDMPKAFAFWQQRLETQYAGDWALTLQGPAGEMWAAAKLGEENCAKAKLRAGLIMQTVARIGPQVFRKAQQFHTAEGGQAFHSLDLQSGLPLNMEMMQTYFSPGNDFFCWRFTSFEQIRVPVLVLAGRYDGTVSTVLLQDLSKEIAGSRFVEFEKSAHWPFVEEPTRFVEAVTGFLQSK